MPIGSGIVYNTGDLILSQVSSSGTAFLETKIAAATSSLIYFDSTARINSASLNSITVGTASYVSGSTSIITNLTASNISASGTGSFGIVGIRTNKYQDLLTIGSSVSESLLIQDNTYNFLNNGIQITTNLGLLNGASGNLNFARWTGGSTTDHATVGQSFNVSSWDLQFSAGRQNTGSTINYFTSSAVRMTIKSTTGDVGIGTTSPLTKLQVKNGSITAGTADSTNGTTILLGQYSSGNLTVLGSEYSSGGPFLGYGVSPSTASAASFFSSTPINIVRSAYIQDGGTHRWYLGPTQSGSIGTVANLSEVMRIASDGSVGIGTTNPTSKLHIVTTGTNDGIILDGSTNPIFIHRTSGSDRTYLATITNAGSFFTDANAYDFVIRSQTSNILLGRGSGASTMAIVGSNVGIGTSSPAQKLEVQSGSVLLRGDGSALFGTYYASAGENTFFTLHSGSGNTFHIGNDVAGTNYNTIVLTAATDSTGGKVGIGTNSPVAKLQVNGNISGSSFTSSVSNAVGFLGTSSWAQNVVTASYLVPTNSYTITNLTASNVSASATGSFGIVGINTTSPSVRLDVRGQVLVNNVTASSPSNQLTINTNGTNYAHFYDLGTSANTLVLGGSPTLTALPTASISASIMSWALNSGNVGIGTTSPSARLTIVDNTNGGTINLVGRTSDDTAAINFRVTGDGSTYAYVAPDTNEFRLYHNDGFMSFYPGGTEKVRITSGGNVGIGTTAPSGSLTVQSNANQLRLQTTSGPGAYFTEISSRYDSTHPFQLGVANNSSTATEFFGIYADSGGSNNRSVFPTGNVGIGTTSPNSKLEVAGGSGTAIISINNTTAGRSGSFGIDSNGVYIQNSNNGDYFDLKNASGTARFRLVYDNNTYINTTYTSVGSLTQSGSKLSVFGNLSVGSTYGSTAAPSNGAIFQGSVGIGTTSPDSSLHVYSTSFEPTIRLTSTSGSVKTYGLVNNPYWATGSFHIYDFTTDNSRIHISSGGNIGIAVGAATPANRLDVVGDLRVRAAGAAMILDTATTSDGRMEYKYNGTRKALIGVDSDNLQISADSGNYLQFRTNSTQRMIINNSGGVGIGTSSPLYLFDIYDTGANSAMMSLRSSGSGNARIYLDAANGDLIGSDYCYLGQEDNTLDFIINTSIAAGNIHLQPKSGGNTGILYVSGSTAFGIVSSQTHQFTGSVNISGSLNATASWANNVVSASYATTAQTANALNTGNSYTVSGLTNNGTLSMGSGYQILATTGTAPIPGIAFVGDTNTGIYAPSADTLGFSISGSERVRIDSSGNLLIGTTTSPSNTGLSIGSTGTVRQILGGMQNTSWRIREKSAIDWCAWTTNINDAGTQDDATKSSWLTQQGFGNGNDAWRLGRYPAGSSTLSTFIYVNSSGNVGIGTTNPGAKLAVTGSGTGQMLAGDAGFGAAGNYTGISLNGTLSTAAYNLLSSPTDSNLYINRPSTSNIYFRSDNNDQMALITNGNFGIGTSNPGARVEISGSGNSALMNIKSPISGAILYVSGSGAVGINTSTVGAYTLQVNGSFAATTKSFVIDHPTKAGKRLIYGSLESPYHGIRLTGRDTLKDGKCKIQLPDYIYKLILHDSVNIQLTGIKCNKTLYVDDINIPENYFTIAYDKALFESYKDYDFFWDFTAIRADVPELNTEL